MVANVEELGGSEALKVEKKGNMEVSWTAIPMVRMAARSVMMKRTDLGRLTFQLKQILVGWDTVECPWPVDILRRSGR